MVAETFEKPKPIVGVVQLLPLPGSPRWQGNLETVIARAEQEATALVSGGVDGLIIENTYDQPYRRERIDTAGAVAMGVIAKHLQHFVTVPMGISVLQNDPETALAIAMNVGAAFIRVPVLVGSMIGESGMVQGKLNDIADSRNRLQLSKGPKIFADVTKNHILPVAKREAPWVSPMAYLSQVVQAIEKHDMVDALIVSDQEVSPEDLKELHTHTDLPMLLDSHLGVDTIPGYHAVADGLILSEGIQKRATENRPTPPSVDLTRIESIFSSIGG